MIQKNVTTALAFIMIVLNYTTKIADGYFFLKYKSLNGYFLMLNRYFSISNVLIKVSTTVNPQLIFFTLNRILVFYLIPKNLTFVYTPTTNV